ncbi:MAG: porin [Gammaproteobacteria bacterium]|nr:porin [Gammaproteobacteria bacterium]
MKNYLPLLLSSVLVLPVAAHAKGPVDGKVYGKINAAVLSTDNKGVSDTFVESHASRLGFKGKTVVDNGMSIIYVLEYEVNPTEKNASKAGSSDTTIFKQRNAIIGLETMAGTIMMGTHDTPMKMAQGKIDLFNDLTYGDIKNVVLGEKRVNDIVMYRSPELKGFALNAAVTQDEDTTTKDDGTSVSVTYRGIKNLYLAAAVDSKIDKTDATRLVAQYRLNDLTVGALLNSSQAANTRGSKEESSTLVSASYKINNWQVKAQFSSGDEKSKGLEQVAFGIDYRLGKKSKLYFYSASLKNDDNSTDKSANGLGIEHKF